MSKLTTTTYRLNLNKLTSFLKIRQSIRTLLRNLITLLRTTTRLLKSLTQQALLHQALQQPLSRNIRHVHRMHNTGRLFLPPLHRSKCSQHNLEPRSPNGHNPYTKFAQTTHNTDIYLKSSRITSFKYIAVQLFMCT